MMTRHRSGQWQRQPAHPQLGFSEQEVLVKCHAFRKHGKKWTCKSSKVPSTPVGQIG
jgi:hypothetical protein